VKGITLCKNLVGEIMKKGFRFFSIFIPVNSKTIIFTSFHGKGYNDSPKAIFEEMKKDERFCGYKFYWAIKGAKKRKIEIDGARVIEYFSPAYFYYAARAKYWVFNCKMPEYLYKKNTQVYLQTWHGTPLKRLGYDIIAPEGTTFYRTGQSFEKMTKSYSKDSARYDYMISPNEFSTEVFQSAFKVKKDKLIETGYPRNDFIVNASAEECLAIKEKYGIPKDKKVVVDAPTWRDNSYNMKGYVFELKADFYKWREILGDEYVLIFKPHYLIVNRYADNKELEGFLYNIPAEAEINELYVISDVLVTDYSSVFFDYAILGRPVYFYMYDLAEYKDELRGFYLDIYKDLPGEIYESEEELLKGIYLGQFDFERMKQFNERFNKFHAGDSSKKVIDILLKGI